MHDNITTNTFPVNSSGINRLDYYIWGVHEGEIIKIHTKWRVLTNINTDHVMRVYQWFRFSIEAIITTDGGCIEYSSDQTVTALL